MPKPGGAADKRGNQYESLWTVRAILQVASGGASSIEIEPLDGGAGIEFVLVRKDKVEHHCVKRQAPNNRGWTLAALAAPNSNNPDRSILRDLLDHTSEGRNHRAVFVSTSSADVLRELIEDRASAAETVADFARLLGWGTKIEDQFHQLMKYLNRSSPETAFLFLRQLEVVSIGESLLRDTVDSDIRNVVRRVDRRDYAPADVRRLLSEWITTTALHSCCRESDIWAHLEEHGYKRGVGNSPSANMPADIKNIASACRKQVDAAIHSSVASKYLPKLYLARSIDGDIVRVLNIDPTTAVLEQMARHLEAENARSYIPPKDFGDLLRARTVQSFVAILDRIAQSCIASAPGFKDQNALRDRFKALRDSLPTIRRTAAMVCDCAGSGKTNVLVRVASDLLESDIPVLFFACRLPAVVLTNLATHISRQLHIAVSSEDAAFSDADAHNSFNTSLQQLDGAKRYLVVMLDGINEATDIAAMRYSLLQLLQAWNNMPVRFIISCRDILWRYFNRDGEFDPYLITSRPLPMPAFQPDQVRLLAHQYFRSFDISGRLIGRALAACSQPILLRFLCEAYKGPKPGQITKLGQVRDVRLRELFDVYWKRKLGEIQELCEVPPARVDVFVHNIVAAMLNQGQARVSVGDLPMVVGQYDPKSESIYQRLRDAAVILEEIPDSRSLDRSSLAHDVVFVYDEFAEYVAAQSFIRSHKWDTNTVEGRLRDLVDVLQTASSFQLKRGMIEYLVMIADMRGEAVSMCKTVAKQGDLLMTANLLRKIKASPVEVVSIVEMCSTAITQVELNRVSLECIFDLGRPNVVRVEVDKHRITEPTRQPHIRKRRITEPTRQSHIYKRRITEPTRQSHIYKMLEPLAQAFVEREDVSSDTIISCVQHWVSGTEVSRVLAACVLRSAVASRPGMVTQTAKLLARAVDQHGHRWIMWTACVALERSGSTDESESDNGVRVSDATAWAEAVHNFGDANIAYQLPVVSTWLESGDKVLTAAAARVISTCKVPLHKGYESYYTSKRVIKRFLFLSRQLISSEERDIMRLRLAEATERYDQIMDG